MLETTVNSHNDWDTLEEIIVGSSKFSNIPKIEPSIEHFFRPDKSALKTSLFGEVPKRIIEETEEDLDELCVTLKRFGVKVRRPNPYIHKKLISTPYWETTSMHSLMPRDCLLVIGNEIIEAPMPCRSRFFEAWAFRDIILDYFKSGAKFTSVPKPRLLDSNYNDISLGKPFIKDLEPLFDAANIIRCGQDIFFNISNTGNKLGLEWLQRNLGESYKVHSISICWDHVGTTLVPLRPGILLANPERINQENLPQHFKNWDIIWAPEPNDTGYGLDWPRGSKWIGMNILSIDKENIIVEKSQLEIIRSLEKYGFNPIPIQFRHGRTFGGGFHCNTLDIRRKGECENYFSSKR